MYNELKVKIFLFMLIGGVCLSLTSIYNLYELRINSFGENTSNCSLWVTFLAFKYLVVDVVPVALILINVDFNDFHDALPSNYAGKEVLSMFVLKGKQTTRDSNELCTVWSELEEEEAQREREELLQEMESKNNGESERNSRENEYN